MLALDASTGAAVGSFSSGGVQKFGGTFTDRAHGVAVSGTTVYACGYFNSTNAGIGGTGAFASFAGSDAFVLALDASTGTAVGGFGSGGVQKFGGNGNDLAFGVAVSGTTVYASGYFNSTNAGIGGTGVFANSGGSDAFMMALDASTGTAVSGFGSDGVQKFGGSGNDRAYGVAVSGTTIYAGGYFNSTNAGVGGTGVFASSGLDDAIVLALDASTGVAVGGFGSGGVQKFGGTSDDRAYGAAVSGTTVYAGGSFGSTNAGVGGIGVYTSAGFSGFLLGLNASTGASPALPQINSSLAVYIDVGTPFSYILTASGSPTGFSALNLPPGLSHSNGTISGTPTLAGTYTVPVSATNAVGTTSASLTLTILNDAVATTYPPVRQGTVQADASQSMAVDGSGNRYVVGNFSGVLDFNPGIGTDVKTSSGSNDAYITRFNADGSYGWTQIFGGNGDDYALAVVVSGTTVYVSGYFSSTNAGVGGTGALTSSGGEDAFVLALNASTGAAVVGFGSGGVQKFGGSNADRAYGVAVSGTTVFASGWFASTNAGVGGTGSFASSGSSDAFVLALDASTGATVGGFTSGGIQKFGGSSADQAYGIAVSGTAVYVCGNFISTNAGVGGTGTIASRGSNDAFVLALDASTGAALGGFGSGGVQKFGGSFDDRAFGVAVSGTNVYASGYFKSPNARIGLTGSFVSSVLEDAFVMALDGSTGAPVAGFGNDGLQKFGGSSDDRACGVAVSGTTVYASGFFSSTNAGVDGTGVFATNGLADAFVLALDASTGAAVGGFGSEGMQTFGGTVNDYAFAVAVSGTKLYVSGNFSSTNAGVGGIGVYSSFGFGSFLLGLDASTGAELLPHITSPLTVGAGVGRPFSYTLTASGSPLGFSALNLPPGLSHNIGTISGTPTLAGTYQVPVSATNAGGTTSASLTLTVLSDAVATSYPPVHQGTASKAPQSVAVDGSGNRYVVGNFSGVLDFNPGIGSDVKASSGLNDAYVTRFNADGSYGWTQIFGGSGDDYALAVAVSGTTVYASGWFASINAGLGGTGSVATSGSVDAFVLALDASTGAAVGGFGSGGVQKFGGSSIDRALGMAVSGTTVYASGYFNSSNAGVGGTGGFASSGDYDAFVLALDASTGAALVGFGSGGVQKFGGTDRDFAYGVAVSGTTVYASGYFDSINAGVNGTGAIATSGNNDAFVLALDASTGAALSAFGSGGVQKFGGGGEDRAFGVAVKGTTVYASGYFTSINAGVGGMGGFASSGRYDAFVLVLDANTGSTLSGFGSGGVQKFGGGGDDFVFGVAVSGTTVYASGYFNSTNAGVGGTGSFATSGLEDAIVLALDASTGAALGAFGSGGVQKFGGSSIDQAFGIAVSGTTVYASGDFSSTNAGVGGAGRYSSAGFGGFLVGLDASTGTAPALPQITSSLSLVAGVGAPFSYTLTASNSPTGFSALNLPPGLSHSNGTISGIPNFAGTYLVPVSATNAVGTTSATLTIVVLNDAVAVSYPPVLQGNVLSLASQSVAVDPAGNRYVVGQFSGTLDFNPGIGADIKMSAGLKDAYVSRFNADSSYAWTQIFGGSGDDSAMAVAISGTTVYVSGYFTSTNAGVGGTGAFTTSGDGDAFVLALDANTGAAVVGFGSGGVQKFGGTGGESAWGVAVSGTTVYASGSFDSTNAGVGGTGAITSSGSVDAFVLALDASTGAAVVGFGDGGVQKFGGSSGDLCYGMAVSGTIVYACGVFGSTNAGVGGTGAIASSGSLDAFVLALDASTGAAMSGFSGGVQTFGGDSADQAYGVAVSGTTIYVSGLFSSTNAGVGGTGTFTTSGLNDAFVLALNASTGAPVVGFGSGGVQKFGGVNTEDLAFGVAVSGTNVYVSGYFDSTNAGVGGGLDDAFVLALDASTGAAVSGFGRGGVQIFGGSGDDRAYGVAVSGTAVYASGNFNSTNAGVGGTGTYTSVGFGGFLLGLNATTGTSTANNLRFSVEWGFGGDVPSHTQETLVPIRVRAVDARGQRVTSFSGTVDFSSSGMLSLGSGTTAAFSNGELTSHNIRFSQSGAFNLVVRATGSTEIGSSNTFTVYASTNTAPGTPVDTDAATNSIAEGATTGSVVGITVAATDNENDALTYSLTDSAGGRFAINGTSGVVTVADGTLLNFEAATSHSITVSVRDGTAATTASFTIAVTNLAPGAPTDSNASANTVAEGVPNGTVVGITASSTDVNGGTISYSLTDSAGGRFAINGTSGVVTVADGTRLNFEAVTSHNIMVSTSDGSHASTATFNIAVTNVNDIAPVIVSSLQAAPNPANTGQVVTFAVSTADVEGDALTTSYDYGDGSSGTAASHVYAAPGLYTVMVSVSDGVNAPAFSSATLLVHSPSSPDADIDGDGQPNSNDTDDDGDGFDDEFELGVGSNPSSGTDTPLSGGASANEPGPLTVTKFGIKLNFTKADSDAISFSGTLSIPAGFSVAGQKVMLSVGGVIKTFTLNAKGASPKANDTFKVSVKAKSGAVAAQVAKYLVKFNKGNFATELTNEGLTNDTIKSEQRTVTILVIFNNTYLRKIQPQLFTATQGKSGKTTTPK